MTGFEGWTAPDLSVTITEPEAREAMEVFSLIDWDAVETNLPKNAVDTTGAPIDRNNRYIRIAFIGEALTMARQAAWGTGLDLLSNPFFEFACGALLDSYDKARKELS